VENDVGRFDRTPPIWWLGSTTDDAFPATAGHREDELQTAPLAATDGWDPEYVTDGMRNIGGTNVGTSGIGRLLGPWEEGNAEVG